MFGSRKIQELENRLYEANETNDKLTREKNDLEQRLSSVTSRASTLADSLDAAETKTADLEGNLADLNSKAAQLEHNLSAETAKNADLERNLSDARYKIADLEQNVSTATLGIADLEQKLSEANHKISDLEGYLQRAQNTISDLEAKLAETEVEQVREETRTIKVEYEGLRDLYAKKVKDFDDSLDEKEQIFARNEAMKRYNLENEIETNRQANQDYVSNTVKQFSDTYNYYLNQIKLLMDALGEVAVQTSQSMLTTGTVDSNLMTVVGKNMVEKLQAGTDGLQGDGLVLIGNPKNEESVPYEAEDTFEEGFSTDPVPEEENAAEEVNDTFLDPEA